jgi:aspartokinase-like uncharacterized kinase
VIVGGGEFANLIRKYDKSMSFSDDVAHETAIDCMDIIAKLLNDKIAKSELVYNLEDAQKAVDSEKIPILMVSSFLKDDTFLEHSWDVTSDSIAAYVSHLIKAKLLIATNVNGIYTRKPGKKNSIFIDEINAKKLLSFEESSIDLMLPELLLKFGANCFVVNGKFPDRVLSLINYNKDIHNFKYTYIRGE